MSIESGSQDREGLDKLAALIAERLSGVGGQVELIEPNPADTYDGRHAQAALQDGWPVHRIRYEENLADRAHGYRLSARHAGAATFRIDGNRAYGLGIADDKQGVALIIHTLSVLKAMNFRDHGLITVLINGDEEVSSAASRAMLTKLGAKHDAVFSFEASRVDQIGCP